MRVSAPLPLMGEVAMRFLCPLLALLCTSARAAAEPNPRGVDFFEKKIRPVLVEHCYACHSKQARKVRGGLLLDSRDGWRDGGDSGPVIVPGHPGKSLLIKALRQDGDLAMPPQKKLSATVVADFVRWIEMGAPDPRTANAFTPRTTVRITEADRKHWSFQALASVAAPALPGDSWSHSAIDRFIAVKLRDKGLAPSRVADKHALLRRATFDLIGLPPTPAELDAFLKDESPQAFEKVVDRLLASKEFGVRWARHWLDGVRYASDVDRSGLYRDWVVRAFNEDLSYFDFVRRQIAGDLIPAGKGDARAHYTGAAMDGVVATGMLALAVWERVGRDLAVAEIVDSQIDVVGRQFLGLTLACARCHDHKFDPISTQDYYALAGIFFSSHISPGKLINDGRLSHDVIAIPLLTREEFDKNRAIDAQIKPLQDALAALEARVGPALALHKARQQLSELTRRAAIKGADRKKLQKEIDALRAVEKKLLAERQRKPWPENPPELDSIARLRERIAVLEKTKIAASSAIGMREGGVPKSRREKIGDVPIYIRGDHRKEGPVVPRRFPVILAGDDQSPLGSRTAGSGRLELADWIAAPANPLTARVMVNRVWQHLFREGLVGTPDNFGSIGDRPTHPELLDYLAQRFVDSKGSVKKLIREIMLSSVYGQSSFATPATLRLDPHNRLLGRMNRKRLEYEALRDSLLFVGGQLGNGKARTLYEPILRNRIDAARVMFDGPDPSAIVPERSATTTTSQALYLLNNPLVAESAQRLSDQLQHLKGDRTRIERAYLQLFARPPRAEEIRIGMEHLSRHSLSDYLHVLLCANEFLYLD